MSGAVSQRIDAVKLGSRDQYTYRAKIDAGGSADLIAATAGYKILVLGLALYLASSQTAKLQSGASTDLTGAMTGTSFVWPFNPAGWVQTTASEKLNLVLGGSVQASGTIVYALVEG